jgi:hypothetical protein
VAAWAEITGDPERSARYKQARGKDGFVRSSWAEVTELIAAADVHTIAAYGPDRVAGFSPIPAMSMVSYAAGTRFLSLIGGTILSFYDWYADLPITRTPDAHFMTGARYRGQKVLRWLTVPLTPGTLGSPYWILMGATAISVLAGARDLALPRCIPVIAATASFTEGFSFAFGQTASLAFMRPIAHVMLWLAVAAWALVAIAFLTRLVRNVWPTAAGPGEAG